jgi:CDP-paratose 2-epimerase
MRSAVARPVRPVTPGDGRPVLVTGGAGFIGVNLAARLAEEGHEVLVLDTLARPGTERNLAWLLASHPGRIAHLDADIRDTTALTAAVRECGAVFHLAAQVAVTDSVSDSATDFSINLAGTFGLLLAVRACGREVPLLFASTNKVYGGLDDVPLERTAAGYAPVDAAIRAHGIGEARPLCFSTPYGCSKGGADQYVLDHAHTYGLSTVVLRMSCIYGPHQQGTEDQGWVAHFVRNALLGRPITLYGDGHQVRDVLHVDDCVAAYLAAWRRMGQVRGRAFNLGGGPANAVSLRGIIHLLEDLGGEAVALREQDWRPADQRYYVSDTRAATAALGLTAPKPWHEGVGELYRWLRDDLAGGPAPAAGPRQAAEAVL